LIRLLLPLALLWAGCHRHESPADAVKRYFTALAVGDCDTAGPLIASDKLTCAGAREEFQEQKVAFLGIDKVEPDGRDPKVMLVSARMSYKKSDHVWIIRAEDHDGRWKLRF
jgi:hypothetical protein